MILRPYQREAVDAVYEFLRTRDDNPCVVIPTAGGKTPVMATICRDAVQVWNGRVLILAHVRELLEQAAEKLHLVAPDLPVGVYSAGLKRRALGYAVTIAGLQSVYQRACDVGAVDLVIVDEAHLIPPDGEGMYRTFLADMQQINPLARVIGLTATPFRMKSGTICSPDNILNAVCFEVGVRELIVQGYLCPLRTKAGLQRPDYDQLHVRGGEYVAGEVEDLMDAENLVLSACREIVEHTQDRKSVLIFASGVRHGEHICRVLGERHKVECGFVCGETLPFQRDEALRRFRAGELKFLCNVNVLTTGFDAPNIDCVALVRPTLSPGLYYQMVGRGFRLHPGKTDCLVLDFGGNVLRHGPVDAIRLADPESHGNGEAPAKECLACYAVHTKRDAPPDAPRTMRVDYKIGFQTYTSEWVCFEHQGFPRQKAEIWWRARSDDPVPDTAEEAVERAEAGALAPTVAITVERREGDRFDRVVAYRLGDKPAVADTPPELACPACGKSERTLQPGKGPHAGQELCAWCGRWLRWVPRDEYEERMLAEVPF